MNRLKAAAKKGTRSRQKAQEGSVLLISLMFLLVVTVLTFTVAESVLLQEKMTTNDKDTVLSLEVAEAALLAAEARIRGMDLATFDTAFTRAGDGAGGGVAGMYDGENCDGDDADCYINLLEDPYADTTWTNAIETSTVDCGTGEPGCKLTGRYLIVRLGQLNVTMTGSSRIEGITNQYQGQGEGALGETYKYKIMAMGAGNNSENRRVIVSYFAQSKPLL